MNIKRNINISHKVKSISVHGKNVYYRREIDRYKTDIIAVNVKFSRLDNWFGYRWYFYSNTSGDSYYVLNTHAIYPCHDTLEIIFRLKGMKYRSLTTSLPMTGHTEFQTLSVTTTQSHLHLKKNHLQYSWYTYLLQSKNLFRTFFAN